MKNSKVQIVPNFNPKIKSGMILIFLLILACFAGSANAFAAHSARYDGTRLKHIFNSDTRKINELNGNWEVSSDEKSWQRVSLPMTYDNSEKVIYRKKINIGKSILGEYSWSLNFLGVNDNVEVYLNDQLVGKYFGGMTQFEVKIPQNLLHASGNLLKIAVSPESGVPMRIKEQNMYSQKTNIGILREVFLIGYPQVRVKEIGYTSSIANDRSSASLQAKITVASGQIARLLREISATDSTGVALTGKVKVEVEAFLTNADSYSPITGTQVQSIALANERTGTLRYNFNIAAPKLWSPEQPSLYDLHVKIKRGGRVIDEEVKPIGLVKVSVAGGKNSPGMIYVNGMPMQIKGVDYIGDHIASGQSVSPYRLEQDVIAMKTLGANVVRMKFTAPHPYFMYLCDKYGLFVISDIPAYNLPTYIYKEFDVISWMKNMAERLTLNYSANPSLLAFGIGEGIVEGSPKVAEIQRDIIRTIRSNTKKLIYKNILISSKVVNLDGIDIIGIKDQAKFRTYDELSGKLKKVLTLLGGKPVVFNFGFPIQIGNSDGYTNPITVEAQRNYMTHIANIVNNFKLSGLIYWAFNDYQLNFPLMTVNNAEQDVCSVGLFSRSRQRRLSYSTLQILYTGQNEQLILTAGNYSEGTPIFYLILGLVLLLALFFYARRFKRFREYLFRSIFHPYNFYADIRDQRIIALAQTFLLAILNSLAFGMIVSAILYFVRTNDIAQQLLVICSPIRSIVPGIFKLIWQPEYFTLVIAAACMLGIFAVSGIIRLMALFVKSKFFYTDAIAIVVWASTPLLVFLPLSMVLIRLMDMFQPFMLISVIIVAAFLIWYLLRIIKATIVVFDVKTRIAYSIATGLLAIFVLINWWYLNSYNALSKYMEYLYNYVMNI